jgi:hypothetical protein
MDPEITSPGVDPGITSIEQADQQAAASRIEAPTISAKDALGLEESPRELLKSEQEKVNAQVPKEKVPRDENGRFQKPAGKVKPAAPAQPTKPAKPAEVAAVPAQPTKPAEVAAAPAQPAKIKIGDKEYTADEIAGILAQQKQAPPAQPQPPAQAAPAPKESSPEEIAALEDQFIGQFASTLADANLSEEGLESILVGGKQGVAALQNLLKGTAARAVLEARKSIYAELNPALQSLARNISPLVENNQQLERHATEAAFVTAYPEYSGEHLNTARYVAEQLIAQFPQQVSQMTREQFLAEVNRQSDRIIGDEFKRWYPSYQGTWRDWAKAQKAPATPAAPTPAPAPAPALTATKPASAPKPAASVRPPAANSPGATTGAPKDWQKGVAGSLVS